MSTKRVVLQNSGLNFVASFSQRVGYTVVFILVARLVLAEGAGAFKLGIIYTSILLTLSLWGLDQLLIREVAKDNQLVESYLGNFLVLRFGLTVFLWLILALIMPFLPYTSESKLLILVMAATVIPGSLSNLFHSVWVANENVKLISSVMVGMSIMRVGGGAILLWQGTALVQIALLFLLVSIVEMIIIGWLTYSRWNLACFQVQFDFSFWIANLKEAAPLFLIAVILVIEYQFDHVILSFFWPEAEVGIYGTAATIVTLLLFFTRSYQLAVFPVISRAYDIGESYLRSVYRRSMTYIVLFALPIAIFVSLASDFIIRLIYGPGYAGAGKILSILVWTFFFSAINIANSRLLVAANQQRIMVAFAFLSMAFYLILSSLIVPTLGGVGTAIARVLTMPIYTILAMVYVQQNITPFGWREFRRPKLFKRAS